MEEFCKFCNKNFGSRQALGGHMRIHYMISSSKKAVDEKFENLSHVTYQENIKNCDSDQSKSYVLRDDPKKTSRFAVSCKQCGKSFSINWLLYGHMKSHPKKSRILDDSTESETKKFYGSNESCSVSSEIREIERAAECLIMMSTGVKDLVTETSDDGSNYNGAANDSEMSLSSGNLDSSDDFNCKLDARNEMKVTLETSVDLIHSADKIKKERLNESPIKLHYAHDLMGCDSTQFTELEDTNIDETISESVKSNSCEKSGVGAQNSGLKRTYSENADKTFTGLTNQDVSKVDQLNSQKNGVVGIVSLNSSKSKESKCPVCFKIFSSSQAMGGHKRVHSIKRKSKEETDAHQKIDEKNIPIAVEGVKADHP